MAYVQAIRFVYLIKFRKHGKKIDPEFDLLSVFLRDGDVAVDVGSNGADWTYQLNRRVGKTGNVFAFEVDPYYSVATSLAIQFMGLKGVKCFSFGLSDKQEIVQLEIIDNVGNRYSGESRINKKINFKNKKISRVELRTSDSLVADYPELMRSKLIKCDVEGYELFVFKGAQKILSVARPIVIMEVGACKSQGYTSKDLFQFFKIRGYLPYGLVVNKKLHITDEQLQLVNAISVNRVIVPIEKMTLIDPYITKNDETI